MYTFLKHLNKTRIYKDNSTTSHVSTIELMPTLHYSLRKTLVNKTEIGFKLKLVLRKSAKKSINTFKRLFDSRTDR